jgi:putative ABC transport system ATP-binding protein
MTLVEARGITKTYTEAGRESRVLDAVDIEFYEGEFAVLLGPSGSGKSTLLNLMSGVDRPDAGDIFIQGTNITGLNERDRTLFRRDNIGIVFQSFNLIPTLTVAENIALPFELQGQSRKVAHQRAIDLLQKVGIGDRGDSFPDRLSGGQQQRVALARAIVHEPLLILADEPTGNLDQHTSDDVMRLLLEMTRDAGKTLIMATHSMDVIPMADRIFRIEDGKLIEDTNALKQGAKMRAEMEARVSERVSENV